VDEGCLRNASVALSSTARRSVLLFRNTTNPRRGVGALQALHVCNTDTKESNPISERLRQPSERESRHPRRLRGPVDSCSATLSNQPSPASPEWVFASPLTGRPYHASPIQQDYLRRAGEKIGLGSFGFHSFRHAYRSWLDAVGSTVGVQQKLMRHSNVSTTMNIYGGALMDEKRAANTRVVQLILATKSPNADTLGFVGVAPDRSDAVSA
jgi:integrase